MIEKFREFVVLADSLNFSRAAEQLFITQPTLSRHISKLEDELGASLLVRSTTSVELTPFGMEVLPKAKELLDAYDSILGSSPAFTVSGNLRIGGFVQQPKIEKLLKQTIDDFQLKFPDVIYSITDTNHLYPEAFLLNGELDVMLSPQPDSTNSKTIAYRYLFDLPICAWVSTDSPAAQHDRITLAQLSLLKYLPWSGELDNPLESRYKAMFQMHNLRLNTGTPFIGYYHETLAEDEFLLAPDFPPEAIHAIRDVRKVQLVDAECIPICAAYLKKSEKAAAGKFAREAQRLATPLLAF